MTVSLEEARRLYPNDVIVRLSYRAPALPHWPTGFECLLRYPKAKAEAMRRGELEPPLAPCASGDVITVRAVSAPSLSSGGG